MTWWDRNVVDAGKLPLLLVLASFIVTWLIVRTITRSIRSGRTDLRNLAVGQTHLHHSTPGLILLTVGAVAGVGLPGRWPWREISATIIGIGASLVFDEFAMLLHLRDDYWQAEGQQSVEAVALVAACLGLAMIGFAPLGIADIGSAELALRLAGSTLVLFTLFGTVGCAMRRASIASPSSPSSCGRSP